MPDEADRHAGEAGEKSEIIFPLFFPFATPRGDAERPGVGLPGLHRSAQACVAYSLGGQREPIGTTRTQSAVED